MRCGCWRVRRPRRCPDRAGFRRGAWCRWRRRSNSDGLAGGLLAYDGQLIDDARLVTAVARTAAQHGARILTYVAASDATATSVRLTDQRSGAVVRGVGRCRHQCGRGVGRRHRPGR